jgi:uncharacterized beta-barrel protein YwiB (DUF1934 family)
MNKPPVQEVKIRVTSEFSMAMAPPDTYTADYSGQLRFMNGIWYIKYVEQEEDGQTNATVKVSEDEIVVIRNGLVSMRQSYRRDAKTSGTYDAGAGGVMQMDTETKDIQLRYDKEGYLQSAAWVYNLYLNGQKIGQYTVHCRLTRS